MNVMIVGPISVSLQDGPGSPREWPGIVRVGECVEEKERERRVESALVEKHGGDEERGGEHSERAVLVLYTQIGSDALSLDSAFERCRRRGLRRERLLRAARPPSVEAELFAETEAQSTAAVICFSETAFVLLYMHIGASRLEHP